MNKALAILGMAKKAGLLAVGSDDTLEAVRRRKAKLVITASDASAGSVERAHTNAKEHKIEYMSVPFTKFELGTTAGRGAPGTIAFLDKGLADGFKNKLTLTENIEFTKESDA